MISLAMAFLTPKVHCGVNVFKSVTSDGWILSLRRNDIDLADGLLTFD
jgi:hypothetical protein